jgi:hypothetical protein
MTSLQVLKQLPTDLQDEIITFEKDIPKGLDKRFNELLVQILNETYHLNRVGSSDWNYLSTDIPGKDEALILLFSAGPPSIGYLDQDDVFRDFKDHSVIAQPSMWRYLNITLD